MQSSLKTHLPYVEVVSLKDGIHNLELQKPEEVANLILEFLNKNHDGSTSNLGLAISQ